MSQMPEATRLASQEERIAWHRERVRREMPVFDFFDWLDSDLTPAEIRGRLVRLRKRRLKLEAKLAACERKVRAG